MKRNTWIAATMSVGALAVGLITTSGAVSATGTNCVPVTHRDLTGVNTETKVIGDEHGQATLTPQGLRVRTPENGSKVWVYFPVKLRLDHVRAMSYTTWKYDNVAPVVLGSYQLVVDATGDGVEDFKLIYEPYQDGQTVVSTQKTWDAYRNGEAKWWKHPVGQQTPLPFKSYVADYPDATIIKYGLNQGSYNAGGDTKWNDLRLKGKHFCETHKWVKTHPTRTPTPTPTVTVTTTPTVTPTTVAPTITATPTPSVTPSRTVSPSPSEPITETTEPPSSTQEPPPGGGDDLPTTGANILFFVAGGLALIAVGVGLFVYARRRDALETL